MIKKIRKVLEELNSNNIEYCILRNYNFLLEKERELKQSERSIDMVVSKKDFTRFEKLMLNMGFVKRKPSFSHKHVPFFRIEDNLERISFDVQIENVHWNDVPYMDVLKNRVKNGFFYVPSVNDTVAMLIIHSILGKRRFKPEYQEIIVNSKIDDIKVTKILEKLFGRKTEIILHLARQGSFGKIINKRLHLFFALRHPYVFAKVTFRWIIWKKLFLPWPLISFIGPDGSGKSTTAKALSKFLAKENRKNVIIYTGRGRNQLLPIRKVGNFYKSKERKKDIRKQAKCTLKKKLIYTLWAPVFTADLLLRYLFVILPKRLKKHVVITDRYSSDIMVMENVPLRFKKFLLMLFPRPTLTFYLYNTPEELHERRPEEPVEGLRRQMENFDRLKLDTIRILSQDKQKDRERIVKAVMEYLLINWY